jgi:hypothetical protein
MVVRDEDLVEILLDHSIQVVNLLSVALHIKVFPDQVVPDLLLVLHVFVHDLIQLVQPLHVLVDQLLGLRVNHRPLKDGLLLNDKEMLLV